MPVDQLARYRSRAARALVLLHEREMRLLLPAWRRAAEAGVRLQASDDPDYASLETLLHHALRASRGYMTWLCERLGLPDPGIEPAPKPELVAREADRYLEHLLERWRVPLQELDPARLDEEHKTRWGQTLSIDGMLEHAVLHPIRHRFQLEELLEAVTPAGEREASRPPAAGSGT
jgi:uncharacterized damage-inducible protein DinB